jgi:ABC-type lipopolysaccharide export system ATPase subunit
MKLSKTFDLYNLKWDEFTERFEAFTKYKRSKLNDLSGGERRLIETYIILKTKSEIVLLDEPFSFLAPILVEQIKQLITEEKKHKVIIISDHMYRHIIESSDTIYLLQNGTTKEIKNLKELEDYRYLSDGSLD